ncbi:hypothetical protein GE061_003032 [Apolygus lucorum]|uniref:Protein kinase domain-containing protein n=1 Tax=Apolygus lucorum TaxID=248454 RepID=A0A6A4JT30_APOLU|nr:hypothetical protein GE061_003032 [Apolygus lucorum]
MDDTTEKTIQECLEPIGYKFIKKIGEGSYANVYSTKYTKDGVTIPMACKILRTEKVGGDEHAMKFITRELNITLNTYHPDIIHTFSVFQRSAIFMIFMRNAEYGNVTNFLIKHGPVKEKVARFWTRQTASALMYLHELDLVHRDMKCDNLLITVNHNVKVADFGFARFTLDMNGKNCKCTTYCGSIPYTAPEILKGVPYDGKPTDVWSLGCILFVMLNKKLPFKSNNNYTKLYQEQQSRKYVWVEKALEVTSKECVEIMSKLLDPSPRNRITCEEFLNSAWVKMDPRLAKTTDAEKQALENAYVRRSEIKPYKMIKINPDTKNQLKILSQDNKQWTSAKELQQVMVNTFDEEIKPPPKPDDTKSGDSEPKVEDPKAAKNQRSPQRTA